MEPAHLRSRGNLLMQTMNASYRRRSLPELCCALGMAQVHSTQAGIFEQIPQFCLLALPKSTAVEIGQCWTRWTRWTLRYRPDRKAIALPKEERFSAF